MATDATGAPTSLGIPTYNVNVDAPSGNGFNAAMAEIDTLLAARALIASPAFTGAPTAPTPTVGDNSTKVATTAFVAALAAMTRQIFTSGTGTYTTPAGVKAILVEALGGGGAGGNAQTGSQNTQAVASGGNGGFYVVKLIVNPAATYAYAVGAGGAGIAAGGTAGATNPGGDTTFGATIVVAKGGLGGTSDNNSAPSHSIPWSTSPPAEAAGSVGDIIVPSEFGGFGLAISSSILIGGPGGKGAGPYGGPGALQVVSVSGGSAGGNNAPAGSPGAGGGGGTAGAFSSGETASGSGNAGLIVVTELY